MVNVLICFVDPGSKYLQDDSVSSRFWDNWVEDIVKCLWFSNIAFYWNIKISVTFCGGLCRPVRCRRSKLSIPSCQPKHLIAQFYWFYRSSITKPLDAPVTIINLFPNSFSSKVLRNHLKLVSKYNRRQWHY